MALLGGWLDIYSWQGNNVGKYQPTYISHPPSHSLVFYQVFRQQIHPNTSENPKIQKKARISKVYWFETTFTDKQFATGEVVKSRIRYRGAEFAPLGHLAALRSSGWGLGKTVAPPSRPHAAASSSASSSSSPSSSSSSSPSSPSPSSPSSWEAG